MDFIVKFGPGIDAEGFFGGSDEGVESALADKHSVVEIVGGAFVEVELLIFDCVFLAASPEHAFTKIIIQL